MAGYDAVVVAGGSSERLGGTDKAMVRVGGRSMLEHALAAVAGAACAVVVGPARDLPAGVLVAREQPPGGGPAAALAAGLSLVTADLVVALAVDMPLIGRTGVGQIVEAALAAEDSDGAWYVDEEGRHQPLAAAYRTPALRVAYQRLGDPYAASMRAVTRHLTLTEVAADPEMTLDCDSWEDVERSRRIFAHQPTQTPKE